MHGGEAQQSRDVFDSLPESDQAALVEFLKSLRVLPDVLEGRIAGAGLTPSAGTDFDAVDWAPFGVMAVIMLVLSAAVFRRNRSPHRG